MEVFKELALEAAHRLPNAPEGHKCRRLHGRSFRVRVCVGGPLDPNRLSSSAEVLVASDHEDAGLGGDA